MRWPVLSRGLVVAFGLLISLSSPAQRTGSPKSKPPAKPAAAEPAPKPCPFSLPDSPSHRIVLKDGNYQTASKCELIGERVHYMSTERSEWEDLPVSLVDWDATNKYELGQGEPKKSAEAAAVDAEEEAERRLEEEKSPEIKPGLRLPSQGGIFLLDVYRDNPELIELVQNGGQLNQNRKSNILRAAINPLSKAKQTIEIKGPRAAVQAHVPQPAIYVNIDADQDARTGPGARDLSDHFRIVRATSKKDARVVGAVEIAVYGKVSQKQNYVQTRSETLNSQWTKVVPVQPLDPGEYALVEMLGKDVNMYVWDFGVSPSAPENASAWKPAPVANTETGTRESPALNKRPPNE
ncbi:MAG: hypothetical protein LAN70_02180 [Acidobacteriia bacterium]|nr:hypothetical protein [Terriglobia bacterium]